MPCPQPHILMCPPDYYGIHYEINPWMDMSRQAEHAVAVEQWHALACSTSTAAGRAVSLLEPVEGLPDLVFTANAAMIYRQQALSVAVSPSAAAGRGAVQSPLARRERLRSRRRAGELQLRRRRRRAVLRRHALRRLPHAERRGRPSADRPDARLPRDSGRAGRRPLLPPRHVLLPARRRAKRSGTRRRSTTTASGRSASTCQQLDRGRAGGSRALRLQRRGHRPPRHHQHRLRPAYTPRLPRAATNRSPRRSTNSSKPAAARSASRCASTAKKPQRGSRRT